jgi:hypothetical protein
LSQQKEDFITACDSTLHYIGGVPEAIVPYNLKAAVTKSNRYEPTLNETFEDFSNHYCTTILPARTFRPRDKALVEGAVRIIYTRIYVPLRKNVYHSLKELNAAIHELLEEHNNRLMQSRPYSRRQQFEEAERETLMPLPVSRHELKKTVPCYRNENGHVSLGPDKNYYSAPYRFIGKKIKLLYSSSTVEDFYHYERIAIHKRTRGLHRYITDKDHLGSNLILKPTDIQ